MTDIQFRSMLDLFMCSDPYPVVNQGNGTGNSNVEGLLNAEAVMRGFESWQVAHHEFTTGSLII